MKEQTKALIEARVTKNLSSADPNKNIELLVAHNVWTDMLINFVQNEWANNPDNTALDALHIFEQKYTYLLVTASEAEFAFLSLIINILDIDEEIIKPHGPDRQQVLSYAHQLIDRHFDHQTQST